MAAPKFLIKIKNRDGSPITFTDYTGAERQAKLAKVGVLFENHYGGYDLVVDRKITIDPAKHFVSVYPNDRPSDAETPQQRRRPDDDIPF